MGSQDCYDQSVLDFVYYEVGAENNLLGPNRLQCPQCGNTVLIDIHTTVTLLISITDNGGLLFELMDNVIDLNRYVPYCSQCGIQMVDNSIVKSEHLDIGCPGCIICGNICPTVFQICRACVKDGADDYGNSCESCEYNYSRIQSGIDLVRLKEHLGINTEDQYINKYDYVDRNQVEMFKKPFRCGYKKIENSNRYTNGRHLYEKMEI
ncbi:MAG: hypothetical protein WCY30_07210 [Candidatus Neomarinimicrobiota bacterium]|jgi:ribosomal protein S27AE